MQAALAEWVQQVSKMMNEIWLLTGVMLGAFIVLITLHMFSGDE